MVDPADGTTLAFLDVLRLALNAGWALLVERTIFAGCRRKQAARLR
jgi:hypothetical protein